MLIPGAVSPEVAPDETEVHDMVMTHSFHAALPESLLRHLRCPLVEELSPIRQRHDIEGVVMG